MVLKFDPREATLKQLTIIVGLIMLLWMLAGAAVALLTFRSIDEIKEVNRNLQDVICVQLQEDGIEVAALQCGVDLPEDQEN